MEVHGEIYWNWIVAVDLFGAGLSAGAFFLSAMAYFLGHEKYNNITRIGAYIAPFPLIIGIICLIIDLERPHLFWKLLLTVQPNSVMSLGAWLLFIFSLFHLMATGTLTRPRVSLLKLTPVSNFTNLFRLSAMNVR